LIERCLAAVARRLDLMRPGWAEDDALAAAARALSEGFTDEQPKDTPSLDPLREAAYLAYFAPRTIAALASAVADREVPDHVLDIGAGTGAASLVLAAAGAKRLTLFERDGRALEVAGALIGDVAPRADVGLRQVDLSREQPTSRAGLAVAAFSLSELSLEPAQMLSLLQTMAPRATRHLVIDAGDRRRARAVQTLRAEALASDWHVAAPCPHEDVCPALERARDWCHARAPRHLDERFAAFAERVGRDASSLSFSWLDLVRDAAAQRAPAALVIGEVRAEKGRVRVPVCGPGGLRFVQALRRHRGAWSAASSLARGARLAPDALVARGDTAHVDDAAALREPEVTP
jgi:hypothetical protein